MRNDSSLGIKAVAGDGVAVMRYYVVDRISLASVAKYFQVYELVFNKVRGREAKGRRSAERPVGDRKANVRLGYVERASRTGREAW